MTFKACLYSFGSLIKKPKKLEKQPIINLRQQVPPELEEGVIHNESNNSNNRFLFNLLVKPAPLPPVITEVSILLNEADSSTDSAKTFECLEKAATLGSACAAAKLALVYRRGVDSNANPDYPSSVAYYLIALTYIDRMPNDKWDMSLILEIIAGLSEIFRKQINRKKDSDIWDNGIRSMRRFELKLQDPSVVKKFTQKDLQRSKAIRIHTNFCMALTAEFDNEFSEAMALYEICRRIGQCNYLTADKLIDKCQHKIEELETKIPKVKPICVSCDYRPEELNDIWGMLVCSKCQVVAACSRECYTAHITAEHPRSS